MWTLWHPLGDTMCCHDLKEQTGSKGPRTLLGQASAQRQGKSTWRVISGPVMWQTGGKIIPGMVPCNYNVLISSPNGCEDGFTHHRRSWETMQPSLWAGRQQQDMTDKSLWIDLQSIKLVSSISDKREKPSCFTPFVNVVNCYTRLLFLLYCARISSWNRAENPLHLISKSTCSQFWHDA